MTVSLILGVVLVGIATYVCFSRSMGDVGNYWDSWDYSSPVFVFAAEDFSGVEAYPIFEVTDEVVHKSMIRDGLAQHEGISFVDGPTSILVEDISEEFIADMVAEIIDGDTTIPDIGSDESTFFEPTCDINELFKYDDTHVGRC